MFEEAMPLTSKALDALSCVTLRSCQPARQADHHPLISDQPSRHFDLQYVGVKLQLDQYQPRLTCVAIAVAVALSA
jgi:hypothetical protein